MSQKGILENMKQEIKRMKFNILGLSEMRWKGAGCITSDGYKILYSGGEHHHREVGVILDPETSKAIKGFWTVSNRTIIVQLQGKTFDNGLIQIYAPTADKDEEVEIYETAKNAMKQLKSQDIKIVIGDFNSKSGSERTETIVGPFQKEKKKLEGRQTH
ncbi:craniofacial development protein 2-like [Plakobranchus ocellatus]|uniref:Craniofacial development protein 2-like n=1 Tax=Plakobranchus ocellatus TaxID=259542 RepID=A0AAV4A0C9_9GAST|nr:craniofacial development protein 2-like [Plakobranchus ocellatus]